MNDTGRLELINKIGKSVYKLTTIPFNLTPEQPRHLGVFGRILAGGAYKKVGYGLSQSQAVQRQLKQSTLKPLRAAHETPFPAVLTVAAHKSTQHWLTPWFGLP